MVHAIRHRHEQSREQFRQQIDKHIHGLRRFWRSKRPSRPTQTSRERQEQRRRRISYLDTGALSGMLEQRAHGSVEMPASDGAESSAALKELQAWQDDPVLVRFVGNWTIPRSVNLPELEVVDSDDPCTTAAEVFARDAADFARLFAAVRIAALEIDDNYNPAIHDSWFASFDWQAFSTKRCSS